MVTGTGNTDDQIQRTLLARAQSGDADAFADLVRPHQAGVYRYLLRSTGHADLADDLAQTTLIRAWRGLLGYREQGRFAAWLYRLARNTLVDAARGARRRDELLLAALDSLPPDRAPSPQEDLEAAEVADALRRAVAALPEPRRSVFLLRHHAALTFREIAELLDLPLGTALSHMHHAVRALRRTLEEYDARV